MFVLSGATLGQIWISTGTVTSGDHGYAIANAGDVDGDGLPDVLAGGSTSSERGTFSGQVRVLEGTTGVELGRVYGTEFQYFGWAVADLGDLDGDGRTEFAAGGLDGFNQTKGVLRIYTVDAPMPASTYCTAKENSQNCTPQIAAQGTPTLSGADDLVVLASDVINDKPGLFLWGRSASKSFAFASVLCIGAPLTRTGMAFTGGNVGPDDCSGVMSFAFTHAYMAQQGIVAGDDIHVQAWYRDPALPFQPAGLSNALLFFVRP